MATPNNDHFEQKSWTVEEFNDVRWTITAIAAVVGLGGSAAIGMATFLLTWVLTGFIFNWFTGFALGVVAAVGTAAISAISFGIYGYFHSVLRTNPKANERFLPIMFNKFVNILIGPGWLFLPFYEICKNLHIFDYEIMIGAEYTLSFNVVERMPGDLAEVIFPPFFYLEINPNDPVKLIGIEGGYTGAFDRVVKRTEQYLQYFICSDVEGPQNFGQARQMIPETINFILEQFELAEFQALSDEIPTQALLGFARNRTLSAFELKIKEKFDALSEEEKEDLMRKANERLAKIEAIRTGNHPPIALHELGLWMIQLGMGDIQLTPRTAKDFNEITAAQQSVKVLKIKSDGIVDRTIEVKVKFPGLSDKEAFEIVQRLEGDLPTTMNINRFELGNDIVGVGAGFLEKLAAKFLDPSRKE